MKAVLIATAFLLAGTGFASALSVSPASPTSGYKLPIVKAEVVKKTVVRRPARRVVKKTVVR